MRGQARGQAMTEYLIALTILTGVLVSLWGPVRDALVAHTNHLDQFISRPVP